MRGSVERILNGIRPAVAVLPQIQTTREKLSSEKSTAFHLDAIVIMGASMDYHRRSGTWKFKTLTRSGVGRLEGGQLRATAAKQIEDEGYTGLFLVTGGNQIGPNGESVSQAIELSRVMTQERRIPEDKVIPIGRATSTNTHGNVLDVVEYISQRKEQLRFRRIGIVANEWHIVRSLLIFNQHPFFQQEGIEIVPIIANDVLVRKSKAYQVFNVLIRRHHAMRERIALEVHGIQDLLNGNYKPRH